MDNRISTACLLLAVIHTVGCVNPGFPRLVGLRLDERRDLAEIRREEREDLVAQRVQSEEVASQRRLEQARIDADRRELESALCEARQENLRDLVDQQLRDEIRSKLSLDLRQNIEFQGFNVDIKNLEKNLKDYQEALKRPTYSEFSRQTCGCPDKQCGCQPGLLRKHCRQCRKKPCGCPPEETCGGPETLRRLENEPLREVPQLDIPLEAKLSLRVGAGPTRIEDSNVHRVPEDTELLRDDCGCPGTCSCPPTPECDDAGTDYQFAPENSRFQQPPPPVSEKVPLPTIQARIGQFGSPQMLSTAAASSL